MSAAMLTTYDCSCHTIDRLTINNTFHVKTELRLRINAGTSENVSVGMNKTQINVNRNLLSAPSMQCGFYLKPSPFLRSTSVFL